MPINLPQLKTDWHELVRPFDPAPQTAAEVFAELVAAYSQPDRFYHNLGHIQQVLHTLAGLRGNARSFPALQMAAWFHDMIYDSRARDNEERSAAHAARSLPPLGVPKALCARVQDLILLTRMHEATDSDTDGHILLDADLAILGAPEEEYARYAHAIRQEYAWVPEQQYRAGRVRVLETFLRRDYIFFTESMRNALEERARHNLAREIASLCGTDVGGRS
jgi:predicted metal-dependent HD superfamily phosphohydrolase